MKSMKTKGLQLEKSYNTIKSSKQISKYLCHERFTKSRTKPFCEIEAEKQRD
jgi:hypothetical protein